MKWEVFRKNDVVEGLAYNGEVILSCVGRANATDNKGKHDRWMEDMCALLNNLSITPTTNEQSRNAPKKIWLWQRILGRGKRQAKASCELP